MSDNEEIVSTQKYVCVYQIGYNIKLNLHCVLVINTDCTVVFF